jgi:hypothetical protein
MLRILLLLLLCSPGVIASETFRIREFGVSLSTPDGWIHDRKATFGYVLRDPRSKNSQLIRVHFAHPHSTSVKNAAARSLEKINEVRSRQKKPVEKIFSSGAVKTRSGIFGWKSAHGFQGASKEPYIVHYYFRRPDGRILCVCSYMMYDPRIEQAYEAIILNTLKFTK